MGSIVEVFPRPAGVRTLADAWRVGPVPGSGAIRTREARVEDYAALRALQRRTAPHMPPCSLRQLESRLLAYPEGQIVATCEGQVVGWAGNLLLPWSDAAAERSWRELTADGFFTTHDPRGQTLYGAELVVDSTRRGSSIGRMLQQARRKLCRRQNLHRIVTTSRLPGYREVREELTPERYAMRVLVGEVAHPAMRFLLAQGFQYCGIVRGFLPEDDDSCGHAALLAWLNPMHAPPGPPAFEESERPRKCA